ncbi:MAG: hypothetical protein M3N54_14050 [Acidobacteriota bacterium]|nr:hypothetical protein [Acidobacteriota bacterium]
MEKASECWKANYASGTAGSAEVLVCGYASQAGAFDALQRTAAAANTVKFQEGNRLALVKWNGVSREEVKALVLGIQRAIR